MHFSLFVIAGVIHLLPGVGVLGAPWLTRLYGVSNLPPQTLVLLRHRAVLFALLGGGLSFAALRVEFQPLMGTAGLLSDASWAVLAWGVSRHDRLLWRVLVFDLASLGCLSVALIA